MRLGWALLLLGGCVADASGVVPAEDRLEGDDAVETEIDPDPEDPFFSPAHILRVPRDYPTVQVAVELAPDRSLIRLAPGTYTEAVRIEGKRVAIAGSGRAVTRIVAPSDDVAAIAFGPGGGGSVRGLSISGGQAGVLGEDPSAGRVRLEDLDIAHTGEGVLGSFGGLVAFRLRISNALYAARIWSSGEVVLKALFADSVGATGILLYNNRRTPNCQVRLENVDTFGNPHGGLIVVGDACPVRILGGTHRLNFIVGVALIDVADFEVRNTMILNTARRATDHLWGDGITVMGSIGTITGLEIGHSARAAVSIYGCQVRSWLAGVAFEGNVMYCNPIDVALNPVWIGDTEPSCGSGSIDVDVRGGNRCRDCPGDWRICEGRSSRLEPMPVPTAPP